MRRAGACRVVLGIVVASWSAGNPGGRAGAVEGKAGPGGEKYALLIGVNNYNKNELRNLPYPDADVEELGQILLANGYRPENVTVMTQKRGAEDFRFVPSAANIRQEMDLLLKDREEGDTVLIALAGHGVQIQGKDDSFFCPADARLADEGTLVSVGEVYRQMERCRAGLKVLLVDACRNNPQSDHSRSRAVVDLASVTRPHKEPPGGVVALFSCSASEKAYEHPELKHGVFFHFVIEGLRGQAAGPDDQGIMVEDLARFVKRRVSDFVRAKYGERQMPELRGEIRGLVPLVTLDAALTRAIEELTQKIRANPKDDASFNNRGNLYHRKGDYALAIADYDASLRLDPNWAQGYMNRARSHQRMGDIDRAIADCSEALRLDPKSFEAYFFRGNIYHNVRKDYSRAIADYTAILRLDPKNSVALGYRGNSHKNLRMADRALADFSEALRLDPRNVQAAWYRGTTYLNLKDDPARAIPDLEYAARLEPKDAAIRSDLGDARFRAGDFDRAIADQTEALRIDPRMTEAFVRRGIAYGDGKGDFDRAIADYSEALRIDPRHAFAHLARGWCRSRRGDLDGALADFDEAIRLNPRPPGGYQKRAEALVAKKEYDRAFADYAEAIRRDPEDGSFLARGHAYSLIKDYGRARADFVEATRLDPKDPNALNDLAWLRATCPEATLRDGRAAVESATRACELSEWKRAMFLDTLAAAYAEAGDFARAIETQKKALLLPVSKADVGGYQIRLKSYQDHKPVRE